MTLDVTTDLVINRPRDEVAAYVTDPAHDPIWIGGIREAEMLTPPPVAEGTRVRRVARFLGRRIEYVLEIAHLDRETEVAMRSVKSPFPMNVKYGFADAPGGTKGDHPGHRCGRAAGGSRGPPEHRGRPQAAQGSA
jgi:hypothetical protein